MINVTTKVLQTFYVTIKLKDYSKERLWITQLSTEEGVPPDFGSGSLKARELLTIFVSHGLSGVNFLLF